METSQKKTNRPTFIQIPNKVKLDPNLKDIDKLVFGEIYTLSMKSGECFARNSYFADIFGKCKSTISESMTNLEIAGYIVRFSNEYSARIITVVVEALQEEDAHTKNKHTIPENRHVISENMNSSSSKLDRPAIESGIPLLKNATYNIEFKKEENKKRKREHLFYNFFSETIDSYLVDLLVDESSMILLMQSFRLFLEKVDRISFLDWKKYVSDNFITSATTDKVSFLKEVDSQDKLQSRLEKLTQGFINQPDFMPERSKNFALSCLSDSRMQSCIREIIEPIVVESYKTKKS